MLDTLRMVRGAVAEKDLIPVLTHFYIYDGRIQGANSRLSIDAPLQELQGVAITVPADRFIKAVDMCESEPTLTVTDSNVILRQGKFHARLPILANDAFPRTAPDPSDWQPESSLLDVLRILRPFVSTDARNIWSMGIWLEEEYAYATNNVVLLRVACDFLDGTKCRINLPAFAVDEILRIGKEPTTFGVSETSVTFYYADGAWIKSQLINTEWPVATRRQLYADKEFKKLPKCPDLLKEAVTKVRPFCGDAKFPVIAFKDGAVITEGAEFGAAVEGFKKLPDARYNANMLALVFEHATHFQPSDKLNLFRVDDGEGIFAPLIT